jgi:phosphoribosyl 1,2-cyclic phosphate phosphodiesterase
MTMHKNKITILGSGTSTGIPMLGCECSVCTSTNPFNKRLRTSIYVQTSKGNRFLVDTTPDLRTQLLRENIKHIDFVFITHDHADHVHGIDDLRPLCFIAPSKSIDIYVHEGTQSYLEKTFPYIFKPSEVFSKERPPLGGGIPNLKLHTLDITKNINIKGDEFQFYLLPHGHTKTLGIQHQKFAYLIDCHEIPKNCIQSLKNDKLDLLMIDCLRLTPGHKSHLWVEKTFDYIRQIQPKSVALIHMNHEIDHEIITKMASEAFDFPVYPVFDGQTLEY